MFRKLVALAICSVLLSGCAQEAPKPTEKVVVEKTAAQALQDFKAIAKDSCDKAMSVGVVESTGTAKAVMVPKDQAYQDYSAAYFDKGAYTLIWESDAFAACSASIQFDMAAEGGAESPIEVVFNSKDGTYQTTQDLGEFGISKAKYTIADGLISMSDDTTVTYGPLSEDDLKILTTAVDNFLAEQ